LTGRKIGMVATAPGTALACHRTSGAQLSLAVLLRGSAVAAAAAALA